MAEIERMERADLGPVDLLPRPAHACTGRPGEAAEDVVMLCSVPVQRQGVS